MKIGLNAISFVPGMMGGMETYFRNLLSTLQQCDMENSYKIYCDSRFAADLALQRDSFTLTPINYAKPSLKWFARGVVRNLFNSDILLNDMRNIDVDVIHHPFTVLTPRGLNIPSVLTFWDMQQEFYPEFFTPLELRKRKLTYRASAMEATRIIVSADFTKRCLVEKYSIDPEKIEVIYTGYGEEFRVIDVREGFDTIREKYGLKSPFIYYPAATWPHKNHKNLLNALKILRDDYKFNGELVLTGIAMKSHVEIIAEAERLGLKNVVKVLGYLPYEDLPYMYNLSTLLVFPSFFEGFGIPLVEAMACGCPVACSNITSLPEIVGDAGILFDPSSPTDIAEKVWCAWSDRNKLIKMREAGLERVKLFDWKQTARNTMAVYLKAAGALT